MRRAKTDRLGLIAFAGAAFLQCPLDPRRCRVQPASSCPRIPAPFRRAALRLPKPLTRPGKLSRQAPDNHRILVPVLPTAKTTTAMRWKPRKAAKEGMIIFTVGIGSAEGGTASHPRRARPRRKYSVTTVTSSPDRSASERGILLQRDRCSRDGFYLPACAARKQLIHFTTAASPAS